MNVFFIISKFYFYLLYDAFRYPHEINIYKLLPCCFPHFSHLYTGYSS